MHSVSCRRGFEIDLMTERIDIAGLRSGGCVYYGDRRIWLAGRERADEEMLSERVERGSAAPGIEDRRDRYDRQSGRHDQRDHQAAGWSWPGDSAVPRAGFVFHMTKTPAEPAAFTRCSGRRSG